MKSSCHPIGKVQDYFYRVEFQQRGSPHIHMFVWIENAPTLETNSEREIVQFVNNYVTCNADNKKTANLVSLQSHKHSRTCRKRANQYVDLDFLYPHCQEQCCCILLKKMLKNTELQIEINVFKDDVDMTFEEFLENIAKMDFDDYICCIRSSLKAQKVFLKRKANEMRIDLFNENILLAWKVNLDIQIVLEPYSCTAYIVGYISKSQRGMSAQLDAAAKAARKGNLDLKKNKSGILEMYFQIVLRLVLKKLYTLICKCL